MALVAVAALMLSTVCLADRPASIHAEQLALHKDLQPAPAPEPLPDWPTSRPLVRKTVYGYYPYWVSGFVELEWDLLTHLAWFGISINPDGSAGDDNGWPDSWAGLVTAAHDNEVRVDVTFTLFSSSGIETLVNSSVNRAAAIETIIDAVTAGDADGASIDFEGVPAAAADGLELFLAELRQAFDEIDEDLQISVAGPAVDWSGAFDLAVLLPNIDVYFIMGYAYFWGGSSHAGPTGILLTDDFWRTYSYGSELRSMAEYSALVDEEQRDKIVMGVPYYGREWTTVDEALGSATIDSIGAVTYAAAALDLEEPDIVRLWDDRSLSPWYVFHDGVDWHQVYYDDEESLAWKYRLVDEQGLGGIGIWALRYDADHEALWDEIDAAFGERFVPHAGDRLEPIPVSDLPFADERDSADLAQGGSYFNFYSCAEDLPLWGREFVYQVEICHVGELTAGVTGDGDGVDNDVQILSALSEDACLARDDEVVSLAVEPGTYFVVVDTYVDNGVLRGGPFALALEGIGIPSPQCEPSQVCYGGECVETMLVFDGSQGGPDAGPDGGGPSAGCDGGSCSEGSGCSCAIRGRSYNDFSGFLGLVIALLP
jgi:hypothetical protein